MAESRDVGIPEGRTEYTERVWRTIHADGTITDSVPVRTKSINSIKEAVRALTEPRPAGQRVLLERTIVTLATPWHEVPTVSNGETATTETKVELT